jgi:hypothetical protein
LYTLFMLLSALRCACHSGDQEFAPSCGDARRTSTTATCLNIVPYGAPAGYEWLVALVTFVCLYFAVRNFMRARR